MASSSCAFSSCSSTRTHPRRRRQQPGWNEPSKALCHRVGAQGRTRGASIKQHSSQHSHRRKLRPWMSSSGLMFAVLFSILLCCQGAEAGHHHVAKKWEGSGELLLDRSPPPVLAPRIHGRDHQEPTSTASFSMIPASSATPPTSGSPLQTATPTASESLPRPFDTSLGNNFTSPSCPAFFQSFLTNETFKDCLPLSLLLQTSQGFFADTRSVFRLTQTLDATCKVPNFQQCDTFMASLAQQIQAEETCGADFEMENPMVMQAYNGLVAYPVLYNAGCLTDTQGNYCFANAVNNASAPSSSYIYYLPLGVQLPGGTRPACNPCLRNTMSIFATYASNDTQPLSQTYNSAADQVDMSCGPRFVDATVAATSGAMSRSTVSFAFTVLVMLLHLSSWL